jgi:sodium/proline symporter
MLKGTTFIGIISLMGWGLGYFGQPHILARFMAADSVKSIAKARRISMTWMILCLGGTVAVGFFGIAYFSAHPEVAGPSPKTTSACSSNWRKSCSTHGWPVSCCRRSWRP